MIQSKVVERAGSALEVGEKYGAGVGRSDKSNQIISCCKFQVDA